MHVDPSVSLYYIAIMPVNGAELYKIFGFSHAVIPKRKQLNLESFVWGVALAQQEAAGIAVAGFKMRRRCARG